MAVDTENRTLQTDEAVRTLLATIEKDFRRQGLPSLAPRRPHPKWLQTTCLIVALSTIVIIPAALALDLPTLAGIGSLLWCVAAVLLVFDDYAKGEFSAWGIGKTALASTPVWFILFRLIFGSWEAAAVAVLGGLAFAVVFILTMTLVLRIGLVTLAVSVFRSLTGARSATVTAAGRAAPITLAVLFVAFLSDEAWKVLAAMSLPRYVGLVVAVLAIASLAAASAAWSERMLLRKAEGAPTSNGTGHQPIEPSYKQELERTCAEYRAGLTKLEQLTHLQKINVALAFASTILARVVIVWVLVGAAFTVIGLIAVDDAVAAALLGRESADGGLTWTLVGLAFLLGAVASLTFAAGALAVHDQRRELVEDQAERLRGRLLAWQQYASLRLVVRDGTAGSPLWPLR